MILKAVIAVSIVCGSALGLAAQSSVQVPTPSNWKADLAASDFGGMPAPKSDTMHITKDTDKMLTWTGVTVDDKGKVWRMGYSGPQDGTLRTVDKMGDKAGFKPDGSSHWVMADGSTMESTISVSDDKMKVTIDNKGKMKDGKDWHQKEVYNRTDKMKSAAM